MGIPGTQAVELASYGGLRARCDLASPGNVDELAAVFEACRREGRLATLRAGGHSFDGQALNTDLVISLDRLDGIAIDAAACRMTAGPGARWGRAVEQVLAHDRMVPVIVSTTSASVGGTLSSNSYSRFTPSRGKEIHHIVELDLLTPTGARWTCSRTQHPDVFRGAIGGLGYLGAVTRIAWALDPGAPKAVQTTILGALPQAEILEGLLATQPGGPLAPSRYSVLLPGFARGLLYESRYLDHEAPWHRYRPVHQPRSLLQMMGQLLFRNRTLTRAIWWLAARTWSHRAYVDPVLDYTFFMDGNARLVRLGRRLGFTMAAAEQTYLVPLGAGPGSRTARVAEFLGEANEVFGAARLTPGLTDVLHVPPDDAILSSSAGLDGCAVTFGFEASRWTTIARIRAAFSALAASCARLGGRVHLTKNVIADPDVLAAMYADAIPRFRALKHRLDPHGMLQNAFLQTRFPALATPSHAMQSRSA